MSCDAGCSSHPRNVFLFATTKFIGHAPIVAACVTNEQDVPRCERFGKSEVAADTILFHTDPTVELLATATETVPLAIRGAQPNRMRIIICKRQFREARIDDGVLDAAFRAPHLEYVRREQHRGLC